ncbi:MAG: C-terminal helicase domain-containing protein [Desulfomonilaceae bacterium]|jgi:superfamily I DNA and/or RNA helicase
MKEGESGAVNLDPDNKNQLKSNTQLILDLFSGSRLYDSDTEKMILDSVSTVDRFQGGQSDVVLVSLGMSDSLVSSHLADEKRLNVAMSRARHKLIVLGNREALEQEDIFVSLFKTMETTLPYSDWCVEAE